MKRYYEKVKCPCTCHKSIFLPNHIFYDVPLCCKNVNGEIKGKKVPWIGVVLDDIDSWKVSNPKDQGDEGFTEGLEKAKQLIMKHIIVEEE